MAKRSVWRAWWSPRDVVRDRAVLREVVRRIINVADPDQVILFGSAARGRLRHDSDFDLLVIKSGVEDTYQLKQKILAHLFGIPVPVDVIVTTPEDLQETGSQWTLIGRIRREGRSLYAAQQRRLTA